jgi:phospholipid-translocating ATPase
MLLLSLALVLLRGSYGSVGESFLLLFKYFLLLSSIIPISMRVNLDFAKLLYKYQIDNDKEMPGCQCRNSNIPEELGRIRYVLTDKTGTLTQNEMIFKRLLLGEGLLFESEEKQQMEKILQE